MKLTFKKTIAGLLCLSMIPAMMTGCKKKTTTYSHTDFAMGTVTNITLYGTSDNLEQTEQKIINMEKKLEKQQLSWRLKSSQVSKINEELEKNNGKTKVTGSLKGWLQQAIKISQDSYADGRNTVDPTIGALTKLWDFESSNPKVPDANKIKKVINDDLSENSQHVTVKDNGEILACDKDTKIDLGAYGKGIGTDEAIKLIKKDKEITGAMVALGGSIAIYGEKSDGSDWNVGIQDPNGQDGEVLGGVKVKSGTSISTSGDYEKYFTDKKTGKRYFHILDSKTGYSVKTDIRSCTIICDSGLNADGLSTACFSLGVKKSQKLLKKYNAKAVFVDNSKEALSCIRQNLEKTHLADRAIVIGQDCAGAIHALDAKKMHFDIIFMDPPYQLNAEKEVLTAIADSKIADEDTQIIIEATLDREFSEDELAGFDVVRVKEYKTNKHIFLQKSSREA